MLWKLYHSHLCATPDVPQPPPLRRFRLKNRNSEPLRPALRLRLAPASGPVFQSGTAGGEAIFAYQNINHRIHLSFVFIRRHIVQRLVWSFIVVVVVPSLRLHPYLINGSEDAGIHTAFELLDGLAFRSYIIGMNGPSYRLRATESWLNSRKEKSTEAKS